jgi:hypothetical protein
MSANHHRVSVEGQYLGQLTAWLEHEGANVLEREGLSNVAAPRVRGQMCASCACKPGTVPNGCVQTQMDMLKAVVEGAPFLCHAPNNGDLCQGWVHARAAHVARPLPTPVQQMAAEWDFSPPDRAATIPTEGS